MQERQLGYISDIGSLFFFSFFFSFFSFLFFLFLPPTYNPLRLGWHKYICMSGDNAG